jgi:hypothetical protein
MAGPTDTIYIDYILFLCLQLVHITICLQYLTSLGHYKAIPLLFYALKCYMVYIIQLPVINFYNVYICITIFLPFLLECQNSRPNKNNLNSLNPFFYSYSGSM